METPPHDYPLDQLHQIKKKRLQEAEKVLREKKERLLKEEEKLRTLKKSATKS